MDHDVAKTLSGPYAAPYLICVILDFAKPCDPYILQELQGSCKALKIIIDSRLEVFQRLAQ